MDFTNEIDLFEITKLIYTYGRFCLWLKKSGVVAICHGKSMRSKQGSHGRIWTNLIWTAANCLPCCWLCLNLLCNKSRKISLSSPRVCYPCIDKKGWRRILFCTFVVLITERKMCVLKAVHTVRLRLRFIYRMYWVVREINLLNSWSWYFVLWD